MTVKRLDKLPKRKLTVDDLLISDDVNGNLELVNSRKHNISDILIVWSEHDGQTYHSFNGKRERLLWMLELVKPHILGFCSEEDDEATD